MDKQQQCLLYCSVCGFKIIQGQQPAFQHSFKGQECQKIVCYWCLHENYIKELGYFSENIPTQKNYADAQIQFKVIMICCRKQCSSMLGWMRTFFNSNCPIDGQGCLQFKDQSKQYKLDLQLAVGIQCYLKLSKKLNKSERQECVLRKIQQKALKQCTNCCSQQINYLVGEQCERNYQICKKCYVYSLGGQQQKQQTINPPMNDPTRADEKHQQNNANPKKLSAYRKVGNEQPNKQPNKSRSYISNATNYNIAQVKLNKQSQTPIPCQHSLPIQIPFLQTAQTNFSQKTLYQNNRNCDPLSKSFYSQKTGIFPKKYSQKSSQQSVKQFHRLQNQGRQQQNHHNQSATLNQRENKTELIIVSDIDSRFKKREQKIMQQGHQKLILYQQPNNMITNSLLFYQKQQPQTNKQRYQYESKYLQQQRREKNSDQKWSVYPSGIDYYLKVEQGSQNSQIQDRSNQAYIRKTEHKQGNYSQLFDQTQNGNELCQTQHETNNTQIERTITQRQAKSTDSSSYSNLQIKQTKPNQDENSHFIKQQCGFLKDSQQKSILMVYASNGQMSQIQELDGNKSDQNTSSNKFRTQGSDKTYQYAGTVSHRMQQRAEEHQVQSSVVQQQNIGFMTSGMKQKGSEENKRDEQQNSQSKEQWSKQEGLEVNKRDEQQIDVNSQNNEISLDYIDRPKQIQVVADHHNKNIDPTGYDSISLVLTEYQSLPIFNDSKNTQEQFNYTIPNELLIPLQLSQVTQIINSLNLQWLQISPALQSGNQQFCEMQQICEVYQQASSKQKPHNLDKRKNTHKIKKHKCQQCEQSEYLLFLQTMCQKCFVQKLCAQTITQYSSIYTGQQKNHQKSK